MRPYEKLDAWASAHRLCTLIFRLTESWPKREWYGLSAQLRRSAFSIPANIVEGQAKRGRREFRRYLDIAWGSYSETRYAIHLGQELGLISGDISVELIKAQDETGRKLWGLMKSIGP